jgi:predicted nucleic acid-binding protein
LECEGKKHIAREFFKENPVVSSQVVSEYINVIKRNIKISK